MATQLSPYMKTLPRDPCGIACSDTQNGIFFVYYYAAPAMLGQHYTDLGIAVDDVSYRVYTQNLEAKDSSFGFGQGSF